MVFSKEELAENVSPWPSFNVQFVCLFHFFGNSFSATLVVFYVLEYARVQPRAYTFWNCTVSILNMFGIALLLVSFPLASGFLLWFPFQASAPC